MKTQSGQIGLVVLLLMTALLTLGVGAVTQSTSDLRDTRQETEASIAFNQAEAGVEVALAQLEDPAVIASFVNNPSETTLTGNFTNTDTQTDVEYTIEKVFSITNVLLKENETIEVNLDGATFGDKLFFNWDNCNTAIEVMFFVENSGTASVQRHALSRTPSPSCPEASNYPGFTTVSGTYESTITPVVTGGNNLRLVRIRAIGGDTSVTVTTEGWPLPVQSYRITSTASQQNSDEVKVVELTKSVEALPAIFDFALFSGETITM